MTDVLGSRPGFVVDFSRKNGFDHDSGDFFDQFVFGVVVQKTVAVFPNVGPAFDRDGAGDDVVECLRLARVIGIVISELLKCNEAGGVIF